MQIIRVEDTQPVADASLPAIPPAAMQSAAGRCRPTPSCSSYMSSRHTGVLSCTKCGKCGAQESCASDKTKPAVSGTLVDQDDGDEDKRR